MDVALESTFRKSIGKQMLDALRMSELARQGALEARAGGMRASASGQWDTAIDLYAKSLMLFKTVKDINVEDEVNLGVVLMACLFERWDIRMSGEDSWCYLIERLYAEAKEINSQYCGDIAHFVFALRIKYGDLDGAGLALAEREEFGIPVGRVDWEVLDREYTRSLLEITQA